MKILIGWFLRSVAIVIAAYILPGVHLKSFTTALVLAIVLALFNLFIKPIVLLLTLPLTIVTLGLFAIVINALFILLAAAVVPGFTVDGFWWALAFSLVLSLVMAVFHMLERE